MSTAYLVVTLLAIAANLFSGVAALLHWRPILPGMVKAGVPESWLTFPIGTLKTAGAIGLLLGLVGLPLIGSAAAMGLILFFVCALYTHFLCTSRPQHRAWTTSMVAPSIHRCGCGGARGKNKIPLRAHPQAGRRHS